MTRVAEPEASSLAAVVAVLACGGVAVLPTDTVYGLVAVATDGAATARLFELKGRGAEVPVAVLCADVAQVLPLVASGVADVVEEVARRWWPGPLTLVLPRQPGLGLHLGQPEETIGIRVPDHDLVRAVAQRLGPLAATSANRHGQPTPTTADAVEAALGGEVDLVVDGGELAASASTVIDASVSPWKVLRPGPLDTAEILALAGAGPAPAG